MVSGVITAGAVGRITTSSVDAAATDKIPAYDGSGDLVVYTPDQIGAGISAKTDYEAFVGINDVIDLSAGTWTITRVAQGDYVYRKTAADDTTVVGIDITEQYRTTAAKGFQLTSIDYIFRNTTADLDAHTATLDLVNYTDSGTVTVTSVTLSGTLAVGQDADPQIDTLTVSSPAFQVTADSKYVLEVTVNAAATSIYDFVGAVLNFTRKDL